VRRRAPRGGWPARCDDETLFETRLFIRRRGALLLDAMTFPRCSADRLPLDDVAHRLLGPARGRGHGCRLPDMQHIPLHVAHPDDLLVAEAIGVLSRPRPRPFFPLEPIFAALHWR